MTEELGAISVGLRVGLGTLDRDISHIEKRIGPLEREHIIPFKVGRINTDEIQREIAKITRGQVKIPVSVTLPANAGRVLHRELTAQLKAAGPVPVQIKANLSRTEVMRIKREIELAMRRQGPPINVPITGHGGGGGLPPATGGSSPATPPPRPPVRPTPARSAPLPPQPASAPTAAAPAAPRARTVAPVPASAPKAAPAPRPAPRAATAPVYDFGGLPTGPASSVAYRTRADGTVETIHGRAAGRTASYIQRRTQAQQGRTVSTDTLRSEKSRPRTPETPEELEYASRQMQVRVPLTNEEKEFSERGQRGVRGARRSGARERNEPVLTAAELNAIDIMREDAETENAARREGEVRAPARRSKAYYGRPGSNPAYNRMVSKLQFYKFDPVLGQAFEALQEGELGEARALLTGFSSKLSGADPRDRKKFFKMFRNVENVPPELLEKDAALRALFAEIHSQTDPMFTIKNAGKRASGGPVQGGGLMGRIAAAKAAKEKSYLVGEGGHPETYIDKHGNAEIVGEHGPEVRVFPEDGRVEPFVPVWLRNLKAKDMTRRAAGGPVRGVGNQRFRSFVEGEREAIAGGLLGRSDSGSVQRVFVVNWPAGVGAGGGFVSSPGGASRAAGPMRFANDKEADRFAAQLGGHIGRQMKELLGTTEELKSPKEPEAERPTRATLSPLEALENRLGAGQTSGELRERILGIRSAVAETQQQIPVRSLAPAFGQIAATVAGGRGEALARLNKARDLTDQATKAAGIYGVELKKLSDLETRRTKGETGLEEAIEGQSEATKRAGTNARDLTDQAEGAAKAADSLGLKLRVLAANTLGIVGGTLAFGATLGLAQAGLTAVEQILTPVIERATGFKNISAEITRELGAQTRAQAGAVETTVAQKEAQAGLSDEISKTISPLLAQRAIIEGGNAAFGDQLNLLRTARNVQKENQLGAAGQPTGPFQPPGGVPGVTRSTGGLLGSPVGATPSLFEQLAGEAGEQPIQQIIRSLLGEKDASSLGAGGVMSPEEISQIVQEELKNPRGFDLGRIANATGPALAVADSLEAMKTGLDKVDSKFEIIGQSSSKWNERIQQASNFQLALNGVSQDLIASFDKLGGFAVVNRETGQPIANREEFKQAFEDVLKSSTIPDVAVLLKQLTERQIPAQKAQFGAEGRFQRNVINPGQFALQELANPTPGVGNVPFEAGLVGKGDDAAKKVAASYKSQIGGAVEFVNDQIAEGRDQLVNLVPPQLRGEFSALLGDIEATGRQISNIQIGIQQQQVNLQVAEYNNQLRIARRSLQDAKDIQAGMSGEVRNTLGGMEGQNIALQRQLQLLQFELQQRQINFRLATAGFVAPGTTPEERAARIEFAKTEAAFAQKQLDIQKQLANNQFKGIQITVDRNVTDLVAQISLLEQGRAVTINTAAASRALDVLNKKQALLVQQASSYIEEGVKIVQAALEAAAEVQKQTGKGFREILKQTAEAWGIFGDQAELILNALTSTAPKNSSGGPDDRNKDRGFAGGIVGDTIGPTEITVGEARGEKVAVIKNPKLVASSALGLNGGGGMAAGGSSGALIQMTVVITGNTVREESDLASLAELVAQKVEDRLNQKTALFGLRRA